MVMDMRIMIDGFTGVARGRSIFAVDRTKKMDDVGYQRVYCVATHRQPPNFLSLYPRKKLAERNHMTDSKANKG
jgi:hypothetical protein